MGENGERANGEGERGEKEGIPIPTKLFRGE